MLFVNYQTYLNATNVKTITQFKILKWYINYVYFVVIQTILQKYIDKNTYIKII
jgi:hypothetical protein